MSTTSSRDEPARPLDTNGAPPVPSRGKLPVVRDDRLFERLDRIEREVQSQGDRARTVQRGFSIFALMALLIAMATLIAVAVKLDKKGTPAAKAPAGAAAAAPAAAAPLVHRVTAGLKEFSINPSVRQAAAGRVTFAVRNAGTVTHEFVILKTPKSAGSLLKGARADEAGNVGESGDLAPGKSKTLAVNLKAGHYVLLCNLPGHYKAGQHVDFNVR
jgi:uncharacterized cupredoxin-like copper-binding protein